MSIGLKPSPSASTFCDSVIYIPRVLPTFPIPSSTLLDFIPSQSEPESDPELFTVPFLMRRDPTTEFGRYFDFGQNDGEKGAFELRQSTQKATGGITLSSPFKTFLLRHFRGDNEQMERKRKIHESRLRLSPDPFHPRLLDASPVAELSNDRSISR
jgi:hypothetical protein